jgi:hypothetical protein
VFGYGLPLEPFIKVQSSFPAACSSDSPKAPATSHDPVWALSFPRIQYLPHQDIKTTGSPQHNAPGMLYAPAQHRYAFQQAANDVLAIPLTSYSYQQLFRFNLLYAIHIFFLAEGTFTSSLFWGERCHRPQRCECPRMNEKSESMGIK